MGKVCHLNQEYELSNFHFERADEMMKNFLGISDYAISVAVNPAMQNYQPEEHEKILIHYYKALNYLHLKQYESAEVEARKLNLKQEALNIQTKGKDKKYNQDPFGHIMMGLIYETNKDYNNAFIAYRNAYNIYESNLVFKMEEMPLFLPNTVNKMAKYSGIGYHVPTTQADYSDDEGELIVFWENGHSPIKQEKNMIFSLNQNSQNGTFFFTDSYQSMIIPIQYDFKSKDGNFKASDIGTIRIAHSYYIPRVNLIHNAEIYVNNVKNKFSMASDINKIAFQLEKDNYIQDLGQRLTRATLKKIAEVKAMKENEYLGIALAITNFAIEKSDTRNWQSLPAQIHMTRIPLKKGENTVEIKFDNGKTEKFTVIGNGTKKFRTVVS